MESLSDRYGLPPGPPPPGPPPVPTVVTMEDVVKLPLTVPAVYVPPVVKVLNNVVPPVTEPPEYNVNVLLLASDGLL